MPGSWTTDPLTVAVVGAGYWGPNLIRNLTSSDETELLWVCDIDEARAARAVGPYNTVKVTSYLERVLRDPAVEAVAVATPAPTHSAIVTAALEAGKHVLVEKPLASTAEDGQAMVDLAAARGLTIMCDHTYCYTPAVQKIRELVTDGSIGDVLYVDSVRINLGLVQPDIDVFWDLAPHDLSILDFVLGDTWAPTELSAHGADPLGTGRSCVGYLTLRLKNSALAHVNVNWLSPTKIRTMILGGSRRTVVWDDLNPSQRVSVFDRGVDVAMRPDEERTRELQVSYRLGDIVAPALPEKEALSACISEFVSAVRTRRAPLTDGLAGVRVLRLLEAADKSLSSGGLMIPVP